MKKNNKGSAFVMVLIILAIVGILAAVSMWVSLVNYQMKLTDIKVKNNFYSAESVLDQICVGLQSDVSFAYERAYKTVSTFYVEMSDAERKVEFEKIYLKELKRRLKATDDVTDMSYQIEKLRGYVYQNLQDGHQLPYAQIQVVDRPECRAKNDKDGRMITYDNHIELKGIEVTFTNEEGYTSIIETDISLNIPDLQFINANSMPNTLSYSLIATEGLEVNGNTKIEGSLYAGKDSLHPEGLSFAVKGAVTLEKAKYLVSYGKTKIDVAQELKVNPDIQFWTQDIEVNGGNAVLQGNTFVADDLTLKGISPKVVLGADGNSNTLTGKYVGFGTSQDSAENSSAIILNGKNSSLDMSHLKELQLGGYAFVNTDQVPANLEGVNNLADNNDIKTGESIAVKSGQIAYLIPPECIGVDANQKSLYNKNPLTYEEEKKIKELGYTEVSELVFSEKIGSDLKSVLDGKSIDSVVSKVHVPKDGGLTYYYINLDQKMAATYFRKYYQSNKEGRFELYTDFYTDKIQIQDDSSLVQTVGNCVLFEEEKSKIRAPKSTGLANQMGQYGVEYDALRYIIYPNSDLVTAEDKSRANVFDNLINVDEMKDMMGGSSQIVVEYTNPTSEDNNMKAILINDPDHNYTYKSESDPKGQVALIITTGSVTVDSNFHGTIIAKKKINVTNTAAELSNRKVEDMRNLLKQEIVTGKPVYQVFRDGEDYLIGTASDEENKKKDKISYSDLITYQNWLMR